MRSCHLAVAAAVKRGDLPRIGTQVCVDCGEPATDYDHRNYNKPLDVVPVCRSCNRNRGPAIPHGCTTYTSAISTGFVVARNGVLHFGFEAIDFGNYEDEYQQSPTEPTPI